MRIQNHPCLDAVASRPLAAVAGTSLAAVAVLLASGCSQLTAERGWASGRKVQVQFYSPPGAEITVKSSWGKRYQQIGTDEMLDHRLETIPEEYAIFNLSPGTYQFDYTTVKGFPGVSIYGELEIHGSLDGEVNKFVRGSFIPVKLPSRYYLDSRPLHPTAGPAGASLNEIEVDQLAEGDLIEKVYFIADLDTVHEDIDRINARLDRLRSAMAVLNSNMEYLDARHEDYRRDSVYGDPTTSMDDATKQFWGADRRFNSLEAERQRLENRRYEIREQNKKLIEERRIRRTLLDSMRIINRSGALVLATPEYQWPYHDTSDQITHSRDYDGITIGPGANYHVSGFELDPIGRVVAVMRVGGRHKHWGAGSTAVARRSAPEASRVESRETVHTGEPEMVVE